MAKYITIDTQSLQEFEATKKPKKKKKNREKHQKEEDDSSPFEKFTDPENRTLRNELYTACKTKNTERLRTLLHDLQAKNADCKSTGTSIVTSAVNSEESGETNLTISDIAASESTSLENCEDGRINESTKHLNDTAEMLNYPFGDHGLTLLHVAGLECHKEAVSLLMELGADPCIK
jgi:predicted acyl esterase